ncbi:MAG: SUMF1/EgtB/PvdO family nonheme iron enzyme [Methylobacter sp.]|nr:SUMF1/EgtB/PvdO family nonheme iron enzyme [Methylobacter sp.]
MNWLDWLNRKLSKPQPQADVANVSAQNGGIAVGQANGSTIIVYNQSVPDQVIKLQARGLKLPTERAQNITRKFLEDIQTYYRYLPLKGMGNNGELRLQFPLVSLFIPLNARLTLPKADTLPDGLRLAGRKLSEEDDEQWGGRLDHARPVLELIIQHPVLVILGDPGSGKSTVLRFLAFLLATGQGRSLQLEGFLPLLLPLAAYSERLSKQEDLSLRRFALEYFQARMDLHDLAELLETRLEQGKVLILLDGLDEVKAVHLRNTVVDRVQQFLCGHIKHGNRVIMTSRIIGYQEVRPPEIENLRECTLLDFDEDEIAEFIGRWTQTIEAACYGQQAVIRYEAQREANELISAIEHNPGIRKLAATPLLLTMLVIQKRQGVSLPKHRVMLYEQYIQSLLRDWLLARSLHNSPADLPDDLMLRRVLEPLAWWLQSTVPGKGLVNEADLLAWLGDFYKDAENPGQKVRGCIKDVREYSGLLIDRGGGSFGFMHLTFMEYLAAVSLADRVQNGLDAVLACMVEHADEAEWQETLLLSISYLGIKQKFAPLTTELLRKLLAHTAKSPGSHHELVAAALADMGPIGVTAEGWQSLRKSLVDEGLRSFVIPARKRANIGRWLAEMGDPRSEVLTVDDMLFCWVPRGEFFLGSTDSDSLASGDEKHNAGLQNLDYVYALSKYPVTVAQFTRFVNDSGFQAGDKGCLDGPTNRPVVDVSWDEAMAFCVWLTERWNTVLPQGWRVTLPTEREWEKAARGGLKIPLTTQAFTAADLAENLSSEAVKDNDSPQRLYPWGNDLDNEKLNFDMNIGAVSAVGCYPLGGSPYGCEEMGGNVWEWTRSVYAKNYPDNGSLWLQRDNSDDSEQSRVLRGGGFNDLQSRVRCAARYDVHPNDRDYDLGFRVVLSPLPLDSEASDL